MKRRRLPALRARQKYDSVEVIRTVRDVDRSRVINTTTIVPIYRGPVVQVPVVTRMNFVVRRYEVVETPLSYSYRPAIHVGECRYGARAHHARTCGHHVVRVAGNIQAGGRNDSSLPAR